MWAAFISRFLYAVNDYEGVWFMLSGEEYVIVFVINRDIFTFPSLCRSIVLRPFSCHVHEMFFIWSTVADGEFITHAEVCTGLVRGL